MATMTLDQMENAINSLTKIVDNLQTDLIRLQTDVNSRARTSDLSTSEAALQATLDSQGLTITELERKLAYISLPEETKFYLEEGEVGDFKANFAKLKAMIAKFDQLYSNLVAYSVARSGS